MSSQNPVRVYFLIIKMASDWRFDVAPAEACYSWRRYARHRAALDVF